MMTNTLFCAGTLAMFAAAVAKAAPHETLRNERVVVTEQTLAPGATLALPAEHPSVLVYLDGGSIENAAPTAESGTVAVHRGDAICQRAGASGVRNCGDAALRLVITEILTPGDAQQWGTGGLAPHYRLLVENAHVRAYDIRIPAGTSEPQHSHHDRIVICLSGAELRHEMPGGRTETSTLKTGEIAWRRGGTHVGHNLGKTDLWVIALEPKGG